MQRRDFIRLGLAASCIPSGASRLFAASDQAANDLPVVTADEVAKTAGNVLKQVGTKKLEKSVRLACSWLSDAAQIKTEQLGENDLNRSKLPYTNWKGAIRSHYTQERNYWGAIPGKWTFYGPVWHTGQACKGLALAARYFNDDKILDAAKLAARFIHNQQIVDRSDPDYGMIAAFENHSHELNASCILEGCDGLYTLSDVTGDRQYAQWATDATTWVVNKLYSGDGLFYDGYIPARREIVAVREWNRWGEDGRPLIDDGVLLKAAEFTGDDRFRKIFFDVADCLLRKEETPGNWIGYVPNDWNKKTFHPRMGAWWGRPMWMAYLQSGDKKYRDCFDRVCDWYVKAMRLDGAIMRCTSIDFNTPSSGHATSGTGFACMMFRDQYAHLGNTDYLPQLVMGLNFMRSVQFVKTEDKNMRGAILEKVAPVDQSDAKPWMLRDLATEFFVTSASQVLLDAKAAAGGSQKNTA